MHARVSAGDRSVSITPTREFSLLLSPESYYVDRDCPWCGERLEMTIDGSVGDQEYVEDCQVCCAPIVVTVRIARYDAALPDVWLRREGD